MALSEWLNGSGLFSRDEELSDLRATEEYQKWRRHFGPAVAVVGRRNSVWDYVDSGTLNQVAFEGELLDETPPIVFVPGATGSEDSFFRVQLTLLSFGVRSICVSCGPKNPCMESADDWVESFHELLKAELELDRFHLVGSGLGAFLILCYLRENPQSVVSTVLNHGFCDTSAFHPPPTGPNGLIDGEFLRNHFLSHLPSVIGLNETRAAAVRFMQSSVETLSVASLASRLKLNCVSNRIKRITYDASKITLIDVMETSGTQNREELAKQLRELLPDAKLHLLKSGGNWPYLAAPDDFTLALRVHLRRQGHGAQLVALNPVLRDKASPRPGSNPSSVNSNSLLGTLREDHFDPNAEKRPDVVVPGGGVKDAQKETQTEDAPQPLQVFEKRIGLESLSTLLRDSAKLLQSPSERDEDSPLPSVVTPSPLSPMAPPELETANRRIPLALRTTTPPEEAEYDDDAVEPPEELMVQNTPSERGFGGSKNLFKQMRQFHERSVVTSNLSELHDSGLGGSQTDFNLSPRRSTDNTPLVFFA